VVCRTDIPSGKSLKSVDVELVLAKMARFKPWISGYTVVAKNKWVKVYQTFTQMK